MANKDSNNFIEQIAKAICQEDLRYGGEPWETLSDDCDFTASKQWYRSLAQAAVNVIKTEYVKTAETVANEYYKTASESLKVGNEELAERMTYRGNGATAVASKIRNIYFNKEKG